MKCLIIGSGRFLAPKIIEELVFAQHEVALFDTAPPPSSVADRVKHFAGDKRSLSFYKEECLGFEPDVVAHLSASATDEASAFVDTFRGNVAHLVLASNTNVYLAHGRLRRTEPGSALAVPIKEDSPLREKPLKEDEPGDKREVERILHDSKLPSTILRLAPLYGPRDYLRRFYPLLVRMIDDRPHIVLGTSQSDWKWSHAFVEDAAHAIALAMVNPSDESRVYNVAELKTPTMFERIEHLATVFGWEGRVGVVLDESLPDYMKTPGDFSQDLEIDSTRIRKELGYREPNDYYEGLSASVEWYRNNPPPQMAGKTFNYAAEDALSSEAFH